MAQGPLIKDQKNKAGQQLGNLTSNVNELLKCCNLTTQSPETRALTRTALSCMALICMA